MMRALVAVACSSAVEKSAVVTAVSRTMLIAAPTTVATWDAVARRDTCAAVILSRSFTSLPMPMCAPARQCRSGMFPGGWVGVRG